MALKKLSQVWKGSPVFEGQIKQFERELRDLKTAHTRGLGMISLSEASNSPTQASSLSPATYTAVVTFGDGAFPPILQLAAEDNSNDQNPLAISAPSFNSSTRTATVTIVDFNDENPTPIPTVYAVASTPIVSLTVTENS